LLITTLPLFYFFTTTTVIAAKRKNLAKSIKYFLLKTRGKMLYKNLPAKVARK